jgi:hypothetical protein
MTALAKILQKEYQKKGLISGTSSGVGKKVLEMIDVRNLLFSGGGVGSVVGRKIFGRGYSSSNEYNKFNKDVIDVSSKISSQPSIVSQESVDILISIKEDTRITAKNSVVLPSMARDMNIMRQNMIKLVKAQGETPSRKADMFFQRSREREEIYKSKVKADIEKVKEQKEKSLQSKLTGSISSAINPKFLILAAAIVGVAFILKKIYDVIANWMNFKYPDWFKENFGTTPETRAANRAAVAGRDTAGGMFESLNSQNDASNAPTPAQSNGSARRPEPSRDQYLDGPALGNKYKDKFLINPAAIGKFVMNEPEVRYKDKDGNIYTIEQVRNFLKHTDEKYRKEWDDAWYEVNPSLDEYLQNPHGGRVMPQVPERSEGSSGPTRIDSNNNSISSRPSPSGPLPFQDDAMDRQALNNFFGKHKNLDAAQKDMVERIYRHFKSEGFSMDQIKAVIATAFGESSFNPKAKNLKGEDSHGLFQFNRKGGLGVNPVTRQPYNIEQLQDPDFQMRILSGILKKTPSFMEAELNFEKAVREITRKVMAPKYPESDIEKRLKFFKGISEFRDLMRDLQYAGSTTSGAPVIVDNSNKSVNNYNSAGRGGSIASATNEEFAKIMIEYVV